MTLMETIRAYLGWCPMQASMRPDLKVRPVTAAAAGGQDGPLRVEPGWWHRYHNQLLVAALAASAAAAALFILVEDAFGHLAVWTGLAIGVGAALGFLLSYRKQYARVAAGEFVRANMTPGLRIVRRLSTPAAAVILVAVIGYFVLSDMPGWIVRFTLALSLFGWAQYGVTILWERRHRTTLIAEKGSMYALDKATEGERV
ncbi:MAG: hypothetical protein CVV31_10310 [Methanomicrobiales archaeon HGW-Methanomicrobiales-2]|jgi:hypothetical protein|nr:MAG: hypothetical protein CVV31_10310 [Methanomicrobiales archaeon HGW-Methanomicrobiales-2]